MEGFRLAPSPMHATDAEISGLFRLIEQPPVYRQRYECECGFHGSREVTYPPSHIPCPRCGGVAGAIGAAELVS